MYYSIGLDYGTNSVRALIVDLSNGKEIGTAVYNYPSGEDGIIIDKSDHNLARQNPSDYITGLEETIKQAIQEAKKSSPDFDAAKVIGLGIDTTGSTPLPVDDQGEPLSMKEEFKNNPNAMAWLWKDHTSYEEAARITELASQMHPEYLKKCGGIYSSEWFFSKILHCLNIAPEVFDAAYTWIEICDWIPAVLTGTKPDEVKRSVCAAGHKAMFNKQWGGLPSKDFLSKLNPKLGDLRDRLYDDAYPVGTSAGTLTADWASRLGLPEGIVVSVGAFDAHLGAVGAGINTGTLVKIIGTSTCDILVSPSDKELADIPGICGIVDGSVLPGYYGLEAGQSAVGDIFNWFVNHTNSTHEDLTKKAKDLKPGQSGLLCLDWNNGNRTILVDQRLTGLMVGQTLHTKPEEAYRAIVEATAFGALRIIDRFEEYGAVVEQVVNCGGIAEKNPMVMQIYADVTGREMKLSTSAQTCALGSAIAAAVTTGNENGGYDSFEKAQAKMCSLKSLSYKPDPKNHKVYQQLYKLYCQMHDAFGLKDHQDCLANVMKDLLNIKESVNS